MGERICNLVWRLALGVSILTAVLAASAFSQVAMDGDSAASDGWFAQVSCTQAAQPHWMTPLVTVTPRLEEESRYDISWLGRPDGGTTINYGGGKGLELIPFSRVEIIAGLPPYLMHNSPRLPDGIGDTPILIKYRLLAANEEHGQYILTLFLGVSFPTGLAATGAGRAMFTPTLAYGKGWGNFDVQGTFGVSFPTGDTARLGRPIGFNNAFQYRLWKRLWPELEANASFFPDGRNAGKKQVFLTPGLLLGRFPIHKRLALSFGAGVQIAATHFHTSNHDVILSVRFPF